MTARIRLVLPLIAALVAAAFISPAFAAAATTPLTSISAVVQADQPSRALIVTGTIAQKRDLPATIALPVPRGSTPDWVGEILGGDPSADPQDAFSTTKGKLYDLVVLTVTKARVGQAEIPLPTPTPAGPETLSYSLIAPNSVQVAGLTFVLPAGATVTTSTGGLATSSGPGGAQLLSKTGPLKAGSTMTASVTFTGGNLSAAATTTIPAGTSGNRSGTYALTVVLWIVVVILAALGGRAVLARRKRG